MVNTTISRALSLSAVAAVVVVTLVTSGEIPTILFQGQMAEAQQVSGDITAASGGKPFGGEKVGTLNIDSTGRRTNVSADINDSPGEGNVFEGWLVDAGGSGYKLSLGQFRNGTLDFSQYMVNPYTYKNFEVTEEPAEDPDPNAADSIAGFELPSPFGR
jgi:Anti-sigma-K factor rskA, C-terminal